MEISRKLVAGLYGSMSLLLLWFVLRTTGVVYAVNVAVPQTTATLPAVTLTATPLAALPTLPPSPTDPPAPAPVLPTAAPTRVPTQAASPVVQEEVPSAPLASSSTQDDAPLPPEATQTAPDAQEEQEATSDEEDLQPADEPTAVPQITQTPEENVLPTEETVDEDNPEIGAEEPAPDEKVPADEPHTPTEGDAQNTEPADEPPVTEQPAAEQSVTPAATQEETQATDVPGSDEPPAEDSAPEGDPAALQAGETPEDGASTTPEVTQTPTDEPFVAHMAALTAQDAAQEPETGDDALDTSNEEAQESGADINPDEPAAAQADEQPGEGAEEDGDAQTGDAEVSAEVEALAEAADEGDVNEIVQALDEVDAVLLDEDGQALALDSAEAAALLASQPLVFVPNMGQVDEEARFYVRSLGGTLYFTQSELVLSLPDGLLQTVFKGINEDTVISGTQSLQGVYNYLNTSDEDDWVTDVPLYSGVVYDDIFEGIDLVYEDAGGTIKSTYTVDAGADPSQILWSYLGAESVNIDENGNLVVTTLGGEEGQVNTFVEEAPVSWQEIDGVQTFVQSFYVLHEDGSVGYSFGDYDLGQSLVIDPLTLGYSTYLGGSDNAEVAYDIAVDASGNTYVTGQTTSTNFPTSGAYQTDQTGTDAFVTKFNSSGALVYSTYLGGSGTDIAYGIDVDGSGQAYVTGETTSADGFMTANAGGVDAFVSALNASGNALVYSHNLGGAGDDIGYDISLDGSNSAYISGSSTNNAFVSVAGQGVGGGASDAIVAKYNSAGALQWSTYVGGAGADIAYGIDVDAGGNSYITGSTDSAAFPTTAGVYDTTANGGTDAFISKLNAAGTALSYSTYFGGTGNDVGKDIAVDSYNQAYITGYTDGSLSTVNGYTGIKPGATDAFIAKFDSTGVTHLWGTYYGGTGDDFALALQVDDSGNAYIAGYTTGSLPTSNGYDGTKPGNQDAFVASFNTHAVGSASMNYATYLGGAANDIANGIAVDSSGNVYVAGETYSSDFPLSSAYDSSLAGGSDAFVTKFVPVSSSSSSTNSSSDNGEEEDDTLTPYEAYLQYLEALRNAGYYYYPYYYPYDWPYDYWAYSNTGGTLTLPSGINSVSLPRGSVPLGSFPYVEMRNLYGLPEVSSNVSVLGQPQGLEVITPYGRYLDWLYKAATITFRIPDDTEVPAGKVLAAQYYDRFLHRWVTMPVRIDGKFATLSTTRTGTYFLALVPSNSLQTVYPPAATGSTAAVSTTGSSKTVKSSVSASVTLESERDTIVSIVADSSASAAELVRVEFPAGAAAGARATLSLLTNSSLPSALEHDFARIGSALQLNVKNTNGEVLEQLDKAAALRFTLPADFVLPASDMLVVQYFDEDSGLWFTLPASRQGMRVYALISRPGAYVLAQTTRPTAVDVIDSAVEAAPITLDVQRATSLRFYLSQTAATGKSEYSEAFRLVLPAAALAGGGRVNLRHVKTADVPAGLEKDARLLSEVLDIDLTGLEGQSISALDQTATLRFKLDADYEIPAGKALAVKYYNQDDGDWFEMKALRQGDHVYTPVDQPGLYLLVLLPAD